MELWIDDRRICALIAQMVFLPYISYHLSNVFQLLGIGIPLTLIIYFWVYLDGIQLIGYSFLRFDRNICIAYLLFCLALAYSCIVSPGAISLEVKSLRDFPYLYPYKLLLQSLPIFWGLMALSGDYIGKLWDEMKLYAFATLITSLLDFIFVRVIFASRYRSDSWYMSYAYFTLFANFLIYTNAKQNKQKISMLLALASFGFLFIGGSRGSMFAVCLFLATQVLFSRDLSKKTVMFAAIILAVGAVSLYGFNNLLNKLSEFLTSIGINSRNLNALLENRVTSSEGRNKLADMAIAAIQKKLLFGYGLLGEMKALNGVYSHNFFYAVVLDFGIVFGGAISCFLIKHIIRVVKQRDIYEAALVSSICVKLMFSSSYSIEPEFFLMLGLFTCAEKFNTRKKC